MEGGRGIRGGYLWPRGAALFKAICIQVPRIGC